MAGFGISFLGDEDSNGPNKPSEADHYQEAVRILNLRLPRVIGGQGGIAAAPLLQAGGGMGAPSSPIGPQGMARKPLAGQAAQVGRPRPDVILQALMQMSGLGQGTSPTPRILPGIGDAGAGPSGYGVNGPMSPDQAGPNAPGWTPPADTPNPAGEFLRPPPGMIYPDPAPLPRFTDPLTDQGSGGQVTDAGQWLEQFRRRYEAESGSDFLA